jgi:hypothetical protein
MTVITDSQTSDQTTTTTTFSRAFTDLLEEHFNHEAPQSLADVAAAIAFTSWLQQPIAQAVTELEVELEVIQPSQAAEDAVNLGPQIMLAGMTYAALIGFFLARTLSEAERGWEPWLLAARNRMFDAGYRAAETDALMAAIRETISKLESVRGPID